MLAKHCLEEFKLDCQLRRLTERTIKGYYNNTLNFLIYVEKHYIQYLLSKKLTAPYTNNILKCLRAYFRFAIQEEYIFSNPTLKVKMQKEPNHVNGIQDCSRGNSYHNRKFRDAAVAHGLTADHHEKYGWTITSPSDRLLEFIPDNGPDGYSSEQERVQRLPDHRN